MTHKAPASGSGRAHIRAQYWQILINDFLSLYGDDREFVNAFDKLATEQHQILQCLLAARVSSWETAVFLTEDAEIATPRSTQGATPYYTAVTDFAKTWGLNWLPHQLGFNALHSALLERAHRPESKDLRLRIVALSPIPYVEGINRIGDLKLRRFTIEFSAEFDLESESPAGALARLEIEFREWASEIVGNAVKAYEASGGYELHDTAPDYKKHLRWLYRRVAKKEDAATIKADEHSTQGNIYKQTRRLAKEMGAGRIPTAR